jgi:hypothetical protein
MVHELLVYIDVNLLGESLHTIKKNTQASFVTRKETGLEVNSKKIVCMFLSHEQNSSKYHNIETGNKSRSALLWDITRHRVVIVYRCFRTMTLDP